MSIARNGFPSFVNRQPPPAVAGDFASSEIRAFAPAGPHAFVADTGGVTVGRFAWADPATGKAANVQAANTILGFVHREQGVTLITTFLDYRRDVIQDGFAIDLLTRGAVWARFAAAAAVGARVYADPATGEATTSSGGNVITPFWVVTPVLADATFTGVIAAATGVLTVSSLTAGLLSQGQVLTGTGVPADTFIISQLTGSTPGGEGTYQTSYRGPAVGSTAMVASAGRLAKISSFQVA